MEIVIIGGIAAGMSAAAKAKRMNKAANVTVIEKENYVSFGACGLPYYLGGQFEDENEMFARTPEQIKKAGIHLLLGCQASKIDFSSKQVHVRELETKEEKVIPYDKLMLATGAKPIIPRIDGANAGNVYTITRLDRVRELKERLTDYRKIVVVGGGFIGIEVADRLASLGTDVRIIEAKPAIMSQTFDPEFSEKLKEAMEKEGIHIHLEEHVDNFETSEEEVVSVQTNKGNYLADAVILAVGFRPNTELVSNDIETLENGAIRIDPFGRTSQKDVFAAGDCASIPHRLLGDHYLPLATGANKMGRIVGINLVAAETEMEKYVGTLGSSAIKAGAYEAASTGLTERMAEQYGFHCKTTCIEVANHSNYYTVQEKIMIKLVYDAKSFVLYGAQLFGKNETVLRATGLAAAIHGKLTTKELGFVDFAYAPPFSSTWEAINVAANTAK
ncbi:MULTISPECIES: CoA-disulfide reductase [unclassified Enterococcus]|uniref:CoA-disulfide reductase n=1 Tax=unclassified Enterococcus TaxID=2608891 RepID=UPI0013EC2AEB|nr:MULTISPECIES: CoA-disulfide reductase [unclassified Enterococcus]